MRKLLLLCVVLLAVSIPVTVYDEEYYEDEAVVFSYGEALALALEGLPAIQDLENRIDDLDEERDDLRDLLRRVQWSWSAAAVSNLRHQITEIERQKEHLALDIEIIELRTELFLRNALTGMNNAAINIKIAEASIEISAEHLRRTGLLHQFGLASAGELRVAEQRLAQEEIRLENLRLAKANARGNPNLLLGQPPYQWTYVEFERELPEIPEGLSRHIESIVPTTPTIRQLQININRRQSDRSRHRAECTHMSRRNCEQYIALREIYDRAHLDRDIAIRQMETALRTAYSNLEQLFNRQAAAQVNLDLAIGRLETAYTNLELGRVTQFDVTQAYFDVFSAELEIEMILNEQWVLGLLLAYPVLL